MQSCSRSERVAAGADDASRDYFVAEDEHFLDAVDAALDLLSTDCKTALRWSHDEADVEAAIRATESTFDEIAAICREAGLAVNAAEGDSYCSFDSREPDSQANCTVVECPCFSVGRRRDSILSCSNASAEMTEALERASASSHTEDAVLELPPAPIYVSPTQEMVEVELTDLLTQNREESLKLQQIFEARMAEAELTREEYQKQQAQEMLALQEGLISSRAAIDRIKQELLDGTNRKLEAMHTTITSSQKAIEAGMREQARYWKSICQELVVEKREMARKVAEERGKYTALKAHLANHDDTGADTKASLHHQTSSSGVELRMSKVHSCESASSLVLARAENHGSAASVSPCSTPTVVVPYPESDGEFSSAEASPTHSNSSSRASQSSFRRYYLAQKRDNRVVLR